MPVSMPSPPLFVATVGEEGAGDLRGVRHLFREGGIGRTAWAFISLDGAGLTKIIHRGVGSVRLRVTAEGPGGHSWTDWGTPNPIHALARIVAACSGLVLPDHPKTTATAARWCGGTSINAIPQEAWVEVDLRSEDPGALESLERDFRRICQSELPGVTDSPAERHRVRLAIRDLGRRPAGTTDPAGTLVQAALLSTAAVGEEGELISSSTDANVPMALGIPAVTLGAGGEAGGIHTSDEWYRNVKGPEGILRALLTLVLAQPDND
jgi:acetylornithine deacetylase/succinyl-diaminopimelate desuccinylase-like protein